MLLCAKIAVSGYIKIIHNTKINKIIMTTISITKINHDGASPIINDWEEI